MKTWVILVLAVLLACKSAGTGSQLIGTYEGTLPCADCPGILAKLELRADSTYRQLYTYQERNVSYREEGTWRIASPAVVALRSGGHVTYYRIVAADTLEQLDVDKQRIDSHLNFRLVRK